MANIKIGIDYQRSATKGLASDLDQIKGKIKEIAGIKVENLQAIAGAGSIGLMGGPGGASSRGGGVGSSGSLSAINTYYKAHADGNKELSGAIRTRYATALKEVRLEVTSTNAELEKQQKHYISTTHQAERLHKAGAISTDQAREMQKLSAVSLKNAQDQAKVAQDRLKATKEEVLQLVAIHKIGRTGGGSVDSLGARSFAGALSNGGAGLDSLGLASEGLMYGPIHQKRGVGQRFNEWFTGRGGQNPDGTWSDDARMSVMDKTLVGARAVQGMAGVVGSAAGMSAGYNTMEERNAASIQQNTTARLIRDMAAGTMKTDYFMGLKGMREKATPGGKWDSKEEIQTKQLAEGVGHVAGAVGDIAVVAGSLLALAGAGVTATTGGVGGVAGVPMMAAGASMAGLGGLARTHAANQAGGGVGSFFSNLFGTYDVTQRAKMGEAEAGSVAGIMAGVNAVQQANPWANEALDLLGAEAGWRVSASRTLEGQHNAMRWVGGGFTAAEAGEMAAAGKRRAGMTGMTGGGGSRTASPSQLALQAQELVVASEQARNDARTGYTDPTMLMPGGVMPPMGDTPELRAAQKRRDELAADVARNAAVDKYLGGKGGGMGRVQAYARLSNYGFDPGVSHTAFDSVWEGTGGKAAGVKNTYDLFSKAVALGTERGFSQPRTQETLLNVMARATEGRSDASKEGLQTLLNIFSAGGDKSNPLTVRQAEARGSAWTALENTIQGNQYYRDLGAMKLLGEGVDVQSAAIINDMSISQLLTGDALTAETTGYGVDRQRKLGRWKTLKGLESGSPELAAEIARFEGGDQNAVTDKSLLKALQGKRGFTSDMTKQGIAFSRALISGEDMSAEAAKFFSKIEGDKIGGGSKLDKTAADTIGVQEKFKAILTQEFAKELAKHMGDSSDVKKLAESIVSGKGAEDAGKNMDPTVGGEFVVKILRPYDAAKSFNPGESDQ